MERSVEEEILDTMAKIVSNFERGNSAVLALNAKVAKLCEAHQGIEMQLGGIHTPYKAAVFESLTARGVQGAASGAQ